MSENNLISNFRELQTRLDLARHIVITAHISPDGDALGSELSMYYLLKAMGKQVHILNTSETADIFAFLDPEKIIKKFDKDQHLFLLESADILLCVDIGDIARIGDKLEEQVKQLNMSVINIDHHPAKPGFNYTQEIVETTACSTGTIIFQFIENMHPKLLNKKIAEAIYVAIMSDTGNFRYGNTVSETHRIAAELLKYDIDPALMHQRIYEQFTPERMTLMGSILQNLHYCCDHKFVWFSISKKDMKKANASSDDTDGFSDMMRSIQGVEVAMMLKETDEGTTRVNFRSKGNIEMLTAARQLKGGGHAFACGATSELSLEKAINTIPDMIIGYLKKQGISH